MKFTQLLSYSATQLLSYSAKLLLFLVLISFVGCEYDIREDLPETSLKNNTGLSKKNHVVTKQYLSTVPGLLTFVENIQQPSSTSRLSETDSLYIFTEEAYFMRAANGDKSFTFQVLDKGNRNLETIDNLVVFPKNGIWNAILLEHQLTQRQLDEYLINNKVTSDYPVVIQEDYQNVVQGYCVDTQLVHTFNGIDYYVKDVANCQHPPGSPGGSCTVTLVMTFVDCGTGASGPQPTPGGWTGPGSGSYVGSDLDFGTDWPDLGNVDSSGSSSSNPPSNNTGSDLGTVSYMNTGWIDLLLFKNSLDAATLSMFNSLTQKQAASIAVFFDKNGRNSETEAFAQEVIEAIANDDFSDVLDLPLFNQDPYDVWGHLSQDEKNLIKLHPFKAYQIFKNREIAEQKTSSLFNHNGINDKSDAFRHAFFQAINSRDVGIGVAGDFADAHESEVPQIWELEKQMDLANNEVGLIEGSFSNATNTILADSINQKLVAGELLYLFPIDYADPFFWDNPSTQNPDDGTHGINQNTNLIPTNQ